MREGDRIRDILASLPPEQRLFRINAGMGWSGDVIKRETGLVVLENPRPLHAAPKGWPDLCGWTEITITPDMVGQRVAVFTGVEVKLSGRLRQQQARFRDIILDMGGRFIVDKG